MDEWPSLYASNSGYYVVAGVDAFVLVATGDGSRRATEYSQHNADAAAPVGETSTITSCQRPGGKKKKSFEGSSEVLLGR